MRRPPVLVHLLVAGGLALTASCSSGGDDDATDTTSTSTPDEGDAPATTEDEADHERDLCPDPEAVETVVGGPVDTDRSRGFRMAGSTSGPSVSFQYTACEIELTDGQGTITVARVTKAEVDGEPVERSVYTTLDQQAAAEFDEDGFGPLTEAELTDAHRDGQDVIYRSGQLMVFVEVEVDGEASFDASLAMATALSEADVAIPAEDHDCDELGAVAPASFGAVSNTRPTGGGSSISEVSIDRTGCSIDHASGYVVSITTTDVAGWDAWAAAKATSVLTPQYDAFEIGGFAAFDDGEDLVIDVGDQPLVISTSGDDLEPDAAEIRRRIGELVVAG